MTFTSKARLVLKDVVHVRQKLEDEVDDTAWRLQWILAVVLLRTVGHVLNKVDSQSNRHVKQIVDKLFSQWKNSDEHRIFNEFIKHERDSILKEYDLNITEGPVPLHIQLVDEKGAMVTKAYFIDENIYRPLDGGYYAGEDGRTVLDEAIDWWKRQLDAVDQEALNISDEN